MPSWGSAASGGWSAGPVTSETLGPMSRSYANLFTSSADTGVLGSTKWGQIYLLLLGIDHEMTVVAAVVGAFDIGTQRGAGVGSRNPAPVQGTAALDGGEKLAGPRKTGNLQAHPRRQACHTSAHGRSFLHGVGKSGSMPSAGIPVVAFVPVQMRCRRPGPSDRDL